MSNNRIELVTTVGRIVQGNLYKPYTTDRKGNPLTVKHGPNKGQPRVDYKLKVAFPKFPGQTHWAQRPQGGNEPYWLEQLWQLGHRLYPQIAQSPKFSWKIEDGDDAQPNFERNGRKNCDTEGWAGNWIVQFSSGFAPKICELQNGRWEPKDVVDFVKPGYYVQIRFSADDNTSTESPGLYLNHNVIAFRAYGEEICMGVDLNSAGFGAAPLPPGASSTPLSSSVPLPGMPAIPGGMPASFTAPVASAQPAPFTAPSVPTATTFPSSVPVVPNLQFANGPAPKRMTPAANGIPYEAYIAKGWTDAMLVQHGMMQP